MRDDTKNWAPRVERHETIEHDGLSLRMVSVERQVLMSSTRIETICESLIGWPEVMTAESYSIRLRRDRVLEINGPEKVDGWDAKSECAISDVTDAYTVFEVSGSRALNLLKRGAAVDLDVPSKSAIRLVFGRDTILYRYGSANTYRLHITSPFADALWLNMANAAKNMDPSA